MSNHDKKMRLMLTFGVIVICLGGLLLDPGQFIVAAGSSLLVAKTASSSKENSAETSKEISDDLDRKEQSSRSS